MPVVKDDQVLALTLLEKAALGIFSAATFSMLGWVVITTNETASTVRVLEASVAYIQKDSEKESADRFTGREGRLLERRVSDLEQYHMDGRGSQR
jgi:hypothetical protein